MKFKHLFFSLCAFLSTSLCFAFSEESNVNKMRNPILFESNVGQEDESVLFLARGPRYKTLLTSTGPQFRFNGNPVQFGLALEGSHSNAALKRVGPSSARMNYYFGNDRSKWKTDVPAFEAAIYKDVYPGIDWKFYESEGLVEFDFIVDPGSDASKIRMNLQGVNQVSIDSTGDLIIRIQANEFRMLAPVVYQCDEYEPEKCEGREEIKAEFIMVSDHEIGFELESYDSNKTLVIDPKIAFGTLLGGNTFDNAADVAVDSKGNFYVVGYTEANTRIPGNGDGFVQKFSPAGALIWTTFLVGSSGESAGSIAVNPAGICFVGGSTSSRDFPIAGAFQPNFGGSLDGFIVKLASNGTITKSSFIGGSGRDVVNGVELGTGPKLGNGLYLYGTTDSRNFPRKNALQQQFGGGRQDGFLAIVHSLQFQNLMSTYIGGNGADNISSLALNIQRGDLYAVALVSDKSQADYLTHFQPKAALTKTAQQATPIGSYDWAVDPEPFPGDLLKWKVSLGFGIIDAIEKAFGDDRPSLIAAAPGLAFVVDGCLRQSGTSCNDNAAVLFFDQDLNSLGGFNFGGPRTGAFAINGIKVTKNGLIHVVGDTLSNSLPKVNAIQSTRKGGYEAFLMTINPSTQQLTLSTYLGGPAFDFASSVAADNSGNIFVVGQTSSKNFPTTPGAPKRSTTGTADGYVVKITP